MSSYKNKKIWVTGHNGMVGSALLRSLASEECDLLVTSRGQLDLSDGSKVLSWIDKNKPDFIFHAAAKVGGINANQMQPGDFIRENLQTQINVIDGARKVGVKKLIFVATNCTYPSNLPDAIPEEALLSGMPDAAVRAYAIGKIAGIEMCRAYRKQYGCNFISIIPPNLYGLGDNYHPTKSHVVAGILRRAHEAKQSGASEFVVWGDGTTRRELLWVDDLSDAMKLLMITNTQHDLYNIGAGKDLSIAELSQLILEAVGFDGKIVFDKSKPSGAMRKLLDNSRITSLGWTPKINEQTGLRIAYEDFKAIIVRDQLVSSRY
jgi:GDP-L-fucose synthase